MIADFSTPQRQSAIGVLLMFLDTLREWARALWPILLVSIFKMDGGQWFYASMGLIVIIAIVAVAAYFRYRNFTFYIDNELEEFILTSGIFSKTKTSIQLAKIQQVNINQTLVQKIIGVYELDVDTAGTHDKEAKIRAVSHPMALALKARLMEDSAKATAVEDQSAETTSDSEQFIKISFASLVKTGITSNYVRTFGFLLAGFFWIWDNLMRWQETTQNDFEQYINKGVIMQSLMTLSLLFVVAILVVNLVRVVVRYFNYTVNKQQGSLLLSFGLINTKSTIIRPERVQITTVIQNYFQKKMDVLRIKVRQAGGERDHNKSAIEIPGCTQSERDKILQLFYHCIPQEGVMLKPNFRKLVFAIFLVIVLPLSVFEMAVPKDGLPVDAKYLVAVYVVFVGVLLYFRFRNNRLFLGDRFVIIQSGAWDITREILEIEKIQAITTSQLFWHKGLNIGSLKLHTAGGSVSFQLGKFSTVREYVNLWLYKIESSNANWM